MHKRAVLAGDASGGAGLDPQAYRRCLDSRRLNWGRHFERDLRDARRSLLRDLPGWTNTAEFCR
jgi:hypothetical protein